MSEQAWSAEPWYVKSFSTDPTDKVRIAGGGTVAHTGCETYHGSNPKTAEANAKRIVDCVNAMSGIPNPAEFVRAARELAEAASQYYEEDSTRKLVFMSKALSAFRAAGGGQ